METTWADHALIADERDAFERDGYVMLRQVVEPDLVVRLQRAAARLDAEYRSEPEISRYHLLNRHDLIPLDDAFLDIVDCPATLPKVVGILGWNIQLFHTQLVVTPTAPENAARGGYGWHQDNNRMNVDFETPPPHPRVSVKIGYFLSDAIAEDCGTLAVVPGSHDRGRPQVPIGEQPGGAVQLMGRVGDAVLFDRRIWHSATTNHAPEQRTMLFYGYSYRWLRPKSAMNFPNLLERVGPVRRQLLGWATSANGYFDPQPEDVPLRSFCESIEPE